MKKKCLHIVEIWGYVEGYKELSKSQILHLKRCKECQKWVKRAKEIMEEPFDPRWAPPTEEEERRLIERWRKEGIDIEAEEERLVEEWRKKGISV